MTDKRRDDYDSPWKEALDRYFPEFLALLYPRIHAEIDWSKGHEFLDKELQSTGFCNFPRSWSGSFCKN